MIGRQGGQEIRKRESLACTYWERMQKCRDSPVQAQTVAVDRGVVCEVYSRGFRRENDKKRHKCVSERQKPVCDRRGSVAMVPQV